VGRERRGVAAATPWKTSCRWQGEVKRIEDLTSNEVALWQHLTATRPELRSPFFSLEFAHAVAAAGALARVCLLYDGDKLAGFFPFQFSNPLAKAFAAAERVGGTLNDFSGLVIDTSRHGLIGKRELLRCARLASFDVDHLEESQLDIGLQVSTKRQGARIRVAAEPEAYWSKISAEHPAYYKRFRGQERKIEREFRLVEFTFSEPEPYKLLPLILAEKRKQFKRTGRPDGLAQPWKLRCLDHIARYTAGRCTPVVSALYFDGEWAAFDFSIRAGTVLNSWFPVYNRRFEKLSPGLILLARRIREARQQGIDEIELGEGVSQYKSLFASEFYPVYTDFWHRLTPKGIVFRGYLSGLWRFRKIRKLMLTDHEPPRPLA